MRKLVIGILLLLTVSMMAFDYPVKKIEGKSYYIYTVQKGDGIYAIGRKFKIKAVEIFKANPGIQVDKIFIGQKLYVPIIVIDKDTNQSAFVDYVVSSGETLYGISQKTHLSIDSLIVINPILKKGLRSGLIIRIPNQRSEILKYINTNIKVECDDLPIESISHDSVKPSDFLPLPIVERIDDSHLIRYKVKKSETLYYISKQFDIPIDDIISVNPALKDGLKRGQIIYIPKDHETVSLAMLLDSNLKDAAKQADLEKDSVLRMELDLPDVTLPSNTIKLALLLPFNSANHNIDGSSDRFIDFYKGLLVASKKVRDNGQSLDIYTYDVGNTLSEIDSILALPELKSVDCIVGPAYSTQVPSIEKFAQENKIMTLVPFSNKFSDCNNHPYVLQYNPCRNEIYSKVTHNFIETHEYHYIIADISGANNKGSQLKDVFESTLKEEGMDYDYIHLSSENTDTLKSLVQSNTMLIIGSSSRSDVSEIIKNIKSYNLDNLTLWGFLQWKNSLTLYNKVYYMSLFDEKTDYEYLDTFTHWFSKPAKGLNIRYDMLGYDAMMYLTSNWHKTENGMALMDTISQPKYIISQPNFILTGDQSYVNYGHFLFYYNGITTSTQSL